MNSVDQYSQIKSLDHYTGCARHHDRLDFGDEMAGVAHATDGSTRSVHSTLIRIHVEFTASSAASCVYRSMK